MKKAHLFYKLDEHRQPLFGWTETSQTLDKDTSTLALK